MWRVSVMMALHWGALGVWVITLPSYIGANTGDEGQGIFGPAFIGDVGAAGAMGALLSPVLFGYLVDRWLNTEVAMAVLHAASAVFLAALTLAENQTVFFLIILGYFQVSTPNGSLVSSLALRKLPDSARHFSQVRAAGTVGWIVAGTLVGLWPLMFGSDIETTLLPMKLGVVLHLVAAVYSLTLPATPPARKIPGVLQPGGQRMWTNPTLLMFLLISILFAAPAKFYDSFINYYLNQFDYDYPAFLQNLGQVNEVAVMLALPLFLVRFRLKGLFIVGLLAWVARFALLAFAEGQQHAWMVYTAISLHGFCFVFTFILGQLYIDRMAPRDLRSSAQGAYLLGTFGIGTLIGAKVSGWAQAVWLTPEGVSPAPYDWRAFWLAPCAVSLVAAVMFFILFREAPAKVSPPAESR